MIKNDNNDNNDDNDNNFTHHKGCLSSTFSALAILYVWLYFHFSTIIFSIMSFAGSSSSSTS